MLISVDPADPRPIYVQITDEVRRAVTLGALRADDPLPSVRQLAADLRVNPNTVQQAYRDLERDGVIYVRRGQGCFVAATRGRAADRGALVRPIAERALREAYRAGAGSDELIEAIEAVVRDQDPESARAAGRGARR